MRIFQLAKELNVDSQEIIDALEDMDISVKSNLQALDEPVVAELRELFKPRPSAPAKSVSEDAVQRALAERVAKEKAAEDARLREEQRKEEARRAALARAARKRPTPERAAKSKALDDVSSQSVDDIDESLPLEIEEILEVQELEAPATTESTASVPDEGTAHGTGPGDPPSMPEAEAPVDIAFPASTSRATQQPPPLAPPPSVRPSGLGKAVIAPPPTSAKARAEMLGKRLGDLRQPGPLPSSPAASSAPAPGRAAAPPRQPARPVAPESREVREREASRGKRPRKGQKRATAQETPISRPQIALPPVGEVKISDGIMLKDLAERMNRKAKDIIAKLFLEKRLIATINQALDEETATWAVEAFGGVPVLVGMEEEANTVLTPDVDAVEGSGKAVPRGPVVTMMGHVDHGKTSLLDAIKKTRVAEREAGGITQHIGAYKVTKEHEGVAREIVFLDTPGHQAFTLMRARGATVTDIIVLVVAADDGVMPQTVEAINHARSANVPVIVAVNKIDKAGANPDRVLQQLVEHSVIVEQFGGDTVACFVSAKTLEGLDHLLEMIILSADLKELVADPLRPASGTVLEAQLDKNRGPVATVLVQNGTLNVGDVFVCGSTIGRVRALVDERDRRLESAGPSTPVVIMGLEDVPQAGDQFQVFRDEHKARQIALYRQQKVRDEQMRTRQALPSLETLHQQIREGQVKELRVILKADVQGSAEVLRKALTDLSTQEVQVKVIHTATGAITETDVLLAQASQALIVGFSVRPQRGVLEMAEREGVDVRLHTIIYKITEEIERAMLATLSPVQKEKYLGRAEILQVFKVPKIGMVAGCKVVDGTIRRDAQVRLLRDHVVIYEGRISSLKRFKDDAREVRSGFECGIGLERFNDTKPGDEIEAFVTELVQRESLEATAESRD
ncbi:MAG: translation initiation factor IF-2 [Acidobacteria bacterium]|nr:translation initiation factor IF-2 [Acidobacteriota bacterium]